MASVESELIFGTRAELPTWYSGRPLVGVNRAKHPEVESFLSIFKQNRGQKLRIKND